jgi:ATP-dependent Lon protease
MVESQEYIKDQASHTEAPETLPLLPLKNVVLLPKSITPIIVGRASSIRAVEAALKTNRMVFISTQKNANVESPTYQDVYPGGTRAVILQVMRMDNGSLQILAEGLCRALIEKPDETTQDFINVYYKDVPTPTVKNELEVQAMWKQLKKLYLDYARLHDKMPTDLVASVKTIQEIDFISDTIAMHLNLTIAERQDIVMLANLKRRMLKLCNFLKREIAILDVEKKISSQVQTQVEKSQREYYLTEQMKAIQKELGREDQSSEINELYEKTKKAGLSAEAKEKVEKELRRLEQMPPMSSEAVVSRTYIDWILSLPWNKTSKDTISLEQAERILNENHAGLHKAKDRIIEFLAAKKFSKSLERSPVICLVGPPGVGKTSLAQAIAQSTGREFVRISLGGIKDEAEIRGHRRTYIGALPGKIIQAMKKAKTLNPVILLDEIDKMARDMQGDPASALLEVLDPQQNKQFYDHFLDVGYDLSKVMFIATANMIEGIPYPLFDRMEIITLSGYTEPEKKEIARQFLIPKSLKEYGLTTRQFKLPDDLLEKIINEYTKEAGVRQLERIIAKLMRKAIQLLLKDAATRSVTVTPERVQDWLGYPKYKKTSLNARKDRIGLVTGLAWTEFGGDVLEIEASVLSGKGGLTLTGQLGEVMQESAHAALSYIRSRSTELGLPKSFYSSRDLHLHIPEGATPKDGPSAGITMCAALISALTEKATKPNLAMTGEITLQGRVLSVGGLKEKLLAAKQHDITTVLLPQENYDDIQEVLKETPLDNLKLIFVSTMDEVIAEAFTLPSFKKVVSKKTAKKPKGTTSKKAT